MDESKGPSKTVAPMSSNKPQTGKMLPRMNLAAAARLALLKEKNNGKVAAGKGFFFGARPSPNGTKPRRVLTNKRLSLSSKNRTFKMRRSPKSPHLANVASRRNKKLELNQDGQKEKFSFTASRNIEPNLPAVKNLEMTAIAKEIWDWCATNGKMFEEDFLLLMNHVKQMSAEASNKSAIPRRLNSLKNCSVDLPLDKLNAFINNDNFPVSLMIKFLHELIDEHPALKENALIWHILVTCQIKEGDYLAARKSLEAAYTLKAKPPSRIIEGYRLLTDHVLTLIQRAPQNDLSTVDENPKLQQQCVTTLYLPVSAQKENPSSSRTIDACDEKNEENGLPVPSSICDEQPSITPETDQTVCFRGGISENSPSVRSSSSSEFSSTWSIHDCVSVDSKNSISKIDIKISEFELPKYCNEKNAADSTFRPNQSRSNRQNDINKSNVFLSAQKKFAFINNAKRYTNSETIVTPVRRSTRVDQERLPENLREKLQICDSPSEIGEKDTFVLMKNPVLNDSFGKFDSKDSPN